MTLSINIKTDKFFIAIGKEDSHSFIMFGVYDQNYVQHLLCRVGKDIDEPVDPDAVKCLVMGERFKNVLFSKLRSKLRNERTERPNPENKPISYQAYDTTYDNYLEFIQLLEALQTKENLFSCYKPAKEEGDVVEFVKTSMPVCIARTELGALKKNINEFSVDNTCRHTAINLVKEVQKTPVSSLVSSSFFFDLPYRTALTYGKPSVVIPFYVLPLSPVSFTDLDAEKKRIIEKLYYRMERLVLLEPDSEQTMNKFNSLKNLYLQLVGEQKQLSLNELLIHIQGWKEQNKMLLNTLRKTYFWDSFFTRESATMTMVSGIERDLVRAQKTPIAPL
ncbi:hypothetical protein [uncultured Legionella sp.]|uniref:hypothetical protein n=1 Tax=uncultured Legionella sp. TaxID=210934 RepID=UPI002607068C|nr:hypothetical protein [uncultured Legionella sp.]